VFVLEDLPEGSKCEKLTAEKMRTVFPKADAERRKALAEALDAVIDIGKLNSPERLMHFLGQAAVEMGARARAKEDFYYSAEALLDLDYYKEHPEEALTDGYIRDADGNYTQLPNEEAIANHKYPDINGNNAPGDGWRFAGRGLFHTTGRYNYNRLTKLHQNIFGEYQDFELHPELLEEPKYAVRSAVAYWLDHDFASIADLGTSSDVTDQITAIINLHTDSYGTRSRAVTALASSGVLDSVCQFSVAHPSFDAQ
jgi:putative chitinase